LLRRGSARDRPDARWERAAASRSTVAHGVQASSSTAVALDERRERRVDAMAAAVSA
jgi:hypothetical protein